MGRPGVFINCTTFDEDAKSASADNGMPGVRRVKISSQDFYKLRGNVDTIRPLVALSSRCGSPGRTQGSSGPRSRLKW